ncbi:MAG: histidine kinase [Cytophagales bacterium]|nr:histidine kinase [Cytophagales bacterium]
MRILQKVGEFLATVLLAFLLDMAFGAVTYFSFKSFIDKYSDTPDGGISDFADLLIGNGIEALLAVTVIHVFRLFDKRLRPKWLAYVLLPLAVFAAEQVLFTAFYAPDSFWRSLLQLHPLTLLFGSNIMAASCITYYLTQYERVRNQKISEQEYQLLELKELKTKAELEALQAKINPHFLYNALNSVASLIHENPDKAEQMVLLLSRFFRYSTNAKSQYFTRLADEIEMVKTYLDVEKVRFDERLDYRVTFADERLKDCLVPQFLIQPLVENAIKHGISKITGNGVLRIDVTDENAMLQITITDNGVPFPAQLATGYGLRSTQDKLRLLMGETARMEIVNPTDGAPDKAVRITMPKRFSAFSETAPLLPEPALR